MTMDMGDIKRAIVWLIVAPLWLLLAVFVFVPIAVLLGVLNGLIEVVVLLSGKSLNSYPRRLRFVNRWGSRTWEWITVNTRYVMGGIAGQSEFKLTPGGR